MKGFQFVIFFFFGVFTPQAQNYFFGKVTNEDGVPLSGVSVINIFTRVETTTNLDGHFMIAANTDEEIRFTKSKYERFSVKPKAENFKEPMNVFLNSVPEEIQEVEIKYKPTGDLEEDTKHFGRSAKNKKLDSELAKYIAKKSDHSVMGHSHTEFIQPVGPGFSIGAIENKWDDIDFAEFLTFTLGEEYFEKEFAITKPEITTFIFYVLKNFERKNILKYAICPPRDLARFENEAHRKISLYKNNIPSVSKKQSWKLHLK